MNVNGAPLPTCRESCKVIWEGQMLTARTYVEGERLRVAAMEANLQSNFALLQAWEKKLRALGWNLIYEEATAQTLKALFRSDEVLEAHSVMENDARRNQQSVQQVCHETREMVIDFEKKVTTAKLALQIWEDLLRVLETKTDTHVSALLEMLTGDSATTSMETVSKMWSLTCVCGDPTCFFPIRPRF
ncbi:hypothetical protein KC19_11G088100 [Ceratodon purpureus]|uniref:Uncharacterized protein n=1 Tax=Ceratodon purpureus TaxID=3225 RepID=A0A8T0GGK0_CERPU|nr:hypothetical protein KC19_11G088100 [Ceratodon purpureus]